MFKEAIMCSNRKSQCQKPQNLQDRPEKCSQEQIRKCHGDVKEHPCTAGKEIK